MSKIQESLLYTKTHEWLKLIDDETGIVGITDYAQDQLGDVVYVELPELGKIFKKSDAFGSVESVKAVSDLYAPVDCEIIETNENLASEPALINKDPYGEGWIIKIKIKNKEQISSLLKPEDYKNIIS